MATKRTNNTWMRFSCQQKEHSSSLHFWVPSFKWPIFLFILMWLRKQLRSVSSIQFIDLTHDLNLCIFVGMAYPAPKAMYEKANRFIGKIIEVVNLVVVQFSAPCLILPKALVSYYLYFTTGFRSNAFDLPLPMWWAFLQFHSYSLQLKNLFAQGRNCFQRFPFDWKTPFGYFIAVAFQLMIVKVPLRIIGCFLSIGFAAFIIAITVHKDLKDCLKLINANLKSEPLRGQIRKQFIEFIDLHANMKQLSFEDSGKQSVLTFTFSLYFSSLMSDLSTISPRFIITYWLSFSWVALKAFA